MSSEEFAAAVESVAERLRSALKEPRTAWDLKIELKVPHTMIHLALGRLLAEGKVSLRPEGYTLAVEPVRTASPTHA